MGNLKLSFLAVLSGTLLALMISFNSTLGFYTSAGFSSLMAHLVGFIGSYFLWLLIERKGYFPFSSKSPVYSYFGGCVGACIVIISNITVQSPIGLGGTVALSILGQISFSLVCDIFGYFGLPKRIINKYDLGQMFLVLFGTMIIIFG